MEHCPKVVGAPGLEHLAPNGAAVGAGHIQLLWRFASPRSSRIPTAFSLSATRTTGCFDQPVNDTMANMKEAATAFRKHVCSAVLLIMPTSIQVLRKFASE